MSRRGRAPVRKISPDSIYKDVIVSKFINTLMWEGKKHLAENAFYEALKIAEEKTGTPGIDLFRQAMENVKPVVEVKSRKIGGATYQVPIEVRPERVLSLAMKWLVRYSRLRKERGIQRKLAFEIMDAARAEGGAIKKKEEIQKMAEANRAFAHYGKW